MEHIAKKSKFLDLFIEVTQAITSCLDLDEVFDLIPSKLVKVLNIDAATIRLIDPSGKKLILKAAHGLSDDYLNRGAIDTEEPVFKALQGEPIFIEQAAEDSRIVFHEKTQKEGINSILVVPISIRGKVKGVLRLLTKKPHKFDQDDINFVSALAEQCGIAIENARFVQDQKTWINYFVTIHELSKGINSTNDLNEILEIIVTRLPEIMQLKAATIRFFEQKGKLKLKATHGLSDEYLARGPLDKEASTYYLMQGEPVVITDAQKDIHTIYHKEAEAEGIHSVLAVPISFQEEVIGMLRVLSSEIRKFSEADINFAMAIADQTGIAIQRVLDNVN